MAHQDLPASLLPANTAACFASIGDDTALPALVQFAGDRLEIERDDQPTWSAPVSSIATSLTRHQLHLETIRGERVVLDFKQSWRTLPRRQQTGPIYELGAQAAHEGETTFTRAGMARPSLVTLHMLRFHELARYLEKRGGSYELTKRFLADRAASNALGFVLLGPLLLLLLLVLTACWFVIAVLVPSVLVSQFWEQGFKPVAIAAIALAAALSLAGSNLLASLGPALSLRAWRDFATTGFDTVDHVEDLSHAFAPVNRYGRFRPIALHVAAQLVLPAYSALAGTDVAWPSSKGMLLAGSVALPGIVLFAVVIDALRRSGTDLAAVDPWLVTYGTADNVLLHRSTWQTAVLIVAAGTAFHLGALLIFG